MTTSARRRLQDEAFKPTTDSETVSRPQGTSDSASLLTVDDIALLASLGPVTGSVEHSRFSVAEVLVDAETLQALETFGAVFAALSVNVGPAVQAVPTALRLEALERRLAAAQTLVHRHLVLTVAPIASVSADVHRVIIGSPEGSIVRSSFTKMEKRWRDRFGKGGRPRGKTASAPNAPKF